MVDDAARVAADEEIAVAKRQLQKDDYIKKKEEKAQVTKKIIF
jgi:hypothetical protein